MDSDEEATKNQSSGGSALYGDSVEHKEILLSGSADNKESSSENSCEEIDRQSAYEISTDSAEDYYYYYDDDDIEIIAIKTGNQDDVKNVSEINEIEPNNEKNADNVDGSSKESDKESETTSDNSSSGNGNFNVSIEDSDGETNAASKERGDKYLDAFEKDDLSSSSDEEYEKDRKEGKDLEEGSDEDKGGTSGHLTETRIDLDLPRMHIETGNEMHFFKMPDFLNIETRPFNPQTYEVEAEEEENLDEEGLIKLKLRAENTIRWRKAVDDNGREIRESNSKIIKWSDGSYSFHLGSEIFDIQNQAIIHHDNHVFIYNGIGLEGQGVFRSMMTFRPHSVSTYTRLKVPITSAGRRQKLQKIRVLPNVGNDPEADRLKMIKQEEQKLKASICREKKQWKMKRQYRARQNSSSLESEAYEDDGAISISAIKNKYKAAIQGRFSTNSSDETTGSDKEKAESTKQDNQESDDDSDFDYFKFRKMTGRKRKTAVIEESDED